MDYWPRHHGQLLKLFSSHLQGRILRVVVTGCTPAILQWRPPFHRTRSWNVYSNDCLQSFSLASALADYVTLLHSYNIEEVGNVINATNRHLGNIMVWGDRWQVKFADEKTLALVISLSREDAR
ncbi:hypothetical protein E2C01_019710 [Portunus trituberculatus]|uniref:Uncharacterized protein n=1 Tax=Portunus trituberculatus TaxID=210409 RepID=A0A5B7DZL2_PORTR|nr:hypothetical protein [Portunus trituberculatus]